MIDFLNTMLDRTSPNSSTAPQRFLPAICQRNHKGERHTRVGIDTKGGAHPRRIAFVALPIAWTRAEISSNNLYVFNTAVKKVDECPAYAVIKAVLMSITSTQHNLRLDRLWIDTHVSQTDYKKPVSFSNDRQSHHGKLTFTITRTTFARRATQHMTKFLR